jgi:6-phosphogluconolactonase (cycloisomerase 2 family)
MNPGHAEEVAMRKRWIATAAAVAAVGAAFATTGAAAPGKAAAVLGHVYVNDNTTGVNTVAGFDRLADGTLAPMPGSPFAVGGAGTGHPQASQGSLQLSADGRYLLAVDAGSNEVSVVRVKPDGSLQSAGVDVVPSNGVGPTSIAVSGDLVYVANADAGGSNYTGFRLNPGGHLRALPASTVSLPDGSQPGDVLFSGDGSKLVGTRVGTSQIDSFTVGSDGRLTAAPGSPFAAQGLGPFGGEFRPTDSTQLFVSNAHNGGVNLGTVSAFSVANDGTLSSIGSSPFPDLQNAPCWVEISHDGQYLFAVNTASSSISRFAIAGGGALTLLGSTPLAHTPAGAEDARLSPDGSTLWVIDSGANAVSGFSVDGGNLAELPSSPTAGPVGAAPSGIVVA